MLIQLCWENCTLARLEDEPIDSFWLEATKEEAESFIYPYCTSETVAQSKIFGESNVPFLNEARATDPNRRYCFLVAKDLTTIKAFPVYYPHSPMWQIHSPFKSIPPRCVISLEELKEVKTEVTVRDTALIGLV